MALVVLCSGSADWRIILTFIRKIILVTPVCYGDHTLLLRPAAR